MEEGPLRGCQFFIPAGGAPWADSIVKGKYESTLFAEIEPLAAKGGVFYDIGAHVGFFTLAWRKLGGSQVEAFEPVESNATIVRELLARNQIDRARVNGCALGNYTGQGTLMVAPHDLGATSAAFISEVGGVQELEGSALRAASTAASVPLWKLDEYMAKAELVPPAVMKIDAEGAEATILEGAMTVLKTYRPILFAEVHNIDTGLLVADLLANLNYQLTVLGKNKKMPVCKWTPR